MNIQLDVPQDEIDFPAVELGNDNVRTAAQMWIVDEQSSVWHLWIESTRSGIPSSVSFKAAWIYLREHRTTQNDGFASGTGKQISQKIPSLGDLTLGRRTPEMRMAPGRGMAVGRTRRPTGWSHPLDGRSLPPHRGLHADPRTVKKNHLKDISTDFNQHIDGRSTRTT